MSCCQSFLNNVMMNSLRPHIISLHGKLSECPKKQPKAKWTLAVLYKHSTWEEYKICDLIFYHTLETSWTVFLPLQSLQKVWGFLINVVFIHRDSVLVNLANNMWRAITWRQLLCCWHHTLTSTTSIYLLLPNLHIKASCLTPFCRVRQHRKWESGVLATLKYINDKLKGVGGKKLKRDFIWCFMFLCWLAKWIFDLERLLSAYTYSTLAVHLCM